MPVSPDMKTQEYYPLRPGLADPACQECCLKNLPRKQLPCAIAASLFRLINQMVENHQPYARISPVMSLYRNLAYKHLRCEPAQGRISPF